MDGLSRICFGRRGPKLKIRNFHPNFQTETIEMARYSLKLGNELQMMVEMGTGFMLNFDVPWPFTPRKTELPGKWRTHSGNEIRALCFSEIINIFRFRVYIFFFENSRTIFKEAWLL